MQRIVKRTVTVTSIETWTISIENQRPSAPSPAEQHAEREVEEVESVDVAHSTAGEKND